MASLRTPIQLLASCPSGQALATSNPTLAISINNLFWTRSCTAGHSQSFTLHCFGLSICTYAGGTRDELYDLHPSEVSCNRRYRPVVCCFHIDRIELLLTEVLQWTI